MDFDFNAFLGMAFTLWAGVVAYFGSAIRQDVKGIREEFRAESQRLSEYIVSTETKIAKLEVRVERIIKQNGFSK